MVYLENIGNVSFVTRDLSDYVQSLVVCHQIGQRDHRGATDRVVLIFCSTDAELKVEGFISSDNEFEDKAVGLTGMVQWKKVFGGEIDLRPISSLAFIFCPSPYDIYIYIFFVLFLWKIR